jgi:signal transduction histidine kinase
MMRKMKLSIRLPLLIIVSASVTICIILLLLFFFIRNTVRETETAALTNSLKGYETAIDFYLDEARSVLEITAQGKEVIDYSWERMSAPPNTSRVVPMESEVHKVAQSILKNSRLFEYLLFLNTDGIVYLREPHQIQSGMSSKDLAFTNWYKGIMKTGQTVTSDLHIAPSTQRPTIVIATPVRSSSGKIIGIWAGGINLDTLSQIGVQKNSPTGLHLRYGQVTDSRGLIIAHQGNPQYVQEQTDFSSVPSVQAALIGKTGTMQYINPIDGQEKLAAYMPLTGSSWAVIYVIPVKVAFASIYTMTRYLGLIGLLAIIVMGLGGLAIARQVIKPLEKLRRAAITIGTGNLAERCEVVAGDEIGELAAEFNRMAEALSAKETQLLGYTTLLENANKELEAFTYSVSHDLRAPLRHIDGYVELLINRFHEALPEKGIHYLDTIADSTRQMAAIIEDLLQFSRTGRQEMRQANIDMNLVLQEVLESIKQDNTGRNIEWVVATLPNVYGDYAMLRLVWFNLLNNAAKFTREKEKARIETGCNEDSMEYVFFVRDNGAGFDMQYAHKLFGVFQRLHATEEFEGTGIGLANVRRIIAKHGGRTWAEAALDKGAVFYFTLLKNKEKKS